MTEQRSITENLLVILRCIASGEKTIFEDPDGNYVSVQVKGMLSLHEGCEEKEIESRLKFELYGEYPLSQNAELDYIKNVKPSINFANQ